MALTDEGGMNTTMLVSPTGNIGGGYPYPVYSNNGGNGGFGGDGWWIVLLILLFAAGGWNNSGNNSGGFFGGMPYAINGEVQAGFDQAAIMSGITGVQSGVQNLATQICNSTGNIQMAIANGFSSAEQGANARAIANMQQLFSLQNQFSDCCCENRLANCQTQNIIQNEGNATRFAEANNTRDIIQSQTSGTQAILDKLCQLELDSKNDRIADLERQLTMANLAASQTAQTSRILADNAAQTVALEQYLNPVPIPAYIVQNPNCCPNNNGCGCGNF